MKAPASPASSCRAGRNVNENEIVIYPGKDLLTIGSVNDMFNEKSRDSMEWREEASQTDFDRF